jgi:hypothetical protein
VLLSLLNTEEIHNLQKKEKEPECSEGKEKQNDLLFMSGEGKKTSYTFFFLWNKKKDDSYDSLYENVLAVFHEQIHRLRTDVVQN